MFVALAAALFSSSPVLITWAEPVSPFIKTWARMLIGSVAVGMAAWYTGARANNGAEKPHVLPSAREPVRITRFLLYGLIAATHFFCAIASLSFTTAAHSLALIYTAPIFVTLFSALFLKESIRPRQRLGVLIAIAGIAILVGLEPRMSWRMALGDGLGLLSAVAFGFYSIAGRYERTRYPLLVYASRVYGAAALWLFPLALLALPATSPDAFGPRQLGALVALGLGPLALGHTLYNAALRRVHATYVNIVASQEVTGGIILSWLLLAQVPSPNSLAGALVTLVGVGLVLR